MKITRKDTQQWLQVPAEHFTGKVRGASRAADSLRVMNALTNRRRAHWLKRTAAFALAAWLASFGAARVGRADEPTAPGKASALPAFFSAERTASERRDTRQERLGVLAVYAVVAATVIGGTYLLRDDFVGRDVATTAAGWGGLAVGATAGWAFSAARGCHGDDCADEDATGAFVGGLLGATAGSLAGYFLTRRDGMSRVYTTAAGMAPFAVVLGAVTIVQW